MSSYRSIVGLVVIPIAIAGCSSGPEETTSGAGATTGGSHHGPGAGTGGDGGGFDPGGEVTTYEATMGPMQLAQGAEETRCVLLRLDNPEGVFVRRFRTTLAEGAHHFIVYRTDETTPDPAPKPCKGFAAFLDGEHPIFIAQHAKTDLTFPTDGGQPVGLELAPHQMLRVEMHTLNASSAPLDVTGTLSVDTIPLETAAIHADIAFWGTTHLDAGGDPPGDAIPPNAPGDTGVMFQAALGGTKIFALTTHQHWLAKRMRIWLAPAPGELGQLLVDNGDWADPPVEVFDPPIAFPDPSEAGLAYRCEWNNVTPDPVPFGESAVKNEMCFLWHFYYPAKGFQYCIDGECT